MFELHTPYTNATFDESIEYPFLTTYINIAQTYMHPSSPLSQTNPSTKNIQPLDIDQTSRLSLLILLSILAKWTLLGVSRTSATLRQGPNLSALLASEERIIGLLRRHACHARSETLS